MTGQTPHASASPDTSPSVVPHAHRVTVRKQYRDRVTDLATSDRSQTPWKWRADCTCGWGCLSWSWSREYEVIQSGLSREQYVAECGEPVGGTMPWVWEHLTEAAQAAEEARQPAREAQVRAGALRTLRVVR